MGATGPPYAARGTLRACRRHALYAQAMAYAARSEQGLLVQRTALVSIVVAATLVALKLGVGLATGSLGLVSAGVESSGDAVAALITVFPVPLGRRPAD